MMRLVFALNSLNSNEYASIVLSECAPESSSPAEDDRPKLNTKLK